MEETQGQMQSVVQSQVLRALEIKEAAIDEEIRKLDQLKEDDLEEIRYKRLKELKNREAHRQELLAIGHGSYHELTCEKEFFNAAKKSRLVVVHFYRPATVHCQLVDKTIADLCRKHIETRFFKINAEKSPFLCERLKIWMIPTIMLIKDGKTEHSIVGLDELGGAKFTGEDLETVLFKRGVAEE